MHLAIRIDPDGYESRKRKVHERSFTVRPAHDIFSCQSSTLNARRSTCTNEEQDVEHGFGSGICIGNNNHQFGAKAFRKRLATTRWQRSHLPWRQVAASHAAVSTL